MNQKLWDSYVQALRELREATKVRDKADVAAKGAEQVRNDAYETWQRRRDALLGEAEVELLRS